MVKEIRNKLLSITCLNSLNSSHRQRQDHLWFKINANLVFYISYFLNCLKAYLKTSLQSDSVLFSWKYFWVYFIMEVIIVFKLIYSCLHNYYIYLIFLLIYQCFIWQGKENLSICYAGCSIGEWINAEQKNHFDAQIFFIFMILWYHCHLLFTIHQYLFC